MSIRSSERQIVLLLEQVVCTISSVYANLLHIYSTRMLLCQLLKLINSQENTEDVTSPVVYDPNCLFAVVTNVTVTFPRVHRNIYREIHH